MLKYEEEFKEIEKISNSIAQFGTVFKCVNNKTQKIFAIKKMVKQLINREIAIQHHERNFVELKDSYGKIIIRETTIMPSEENDSLVHYIDYWEDITKDTLYNQMKLCQCDLDSVLYLKASPFGRDKEEKQLCLFEYYLSCEIFKELVECVNYLHSNDPPIIHRDLKPANILILNRGNGRFFKICDFGVSRFYDDASKSMTGGVGTQKYIAPEVYSGDYNTKADIYSLGIVIEKLFDTSIGNGVYLECENKILNEELKLFSETLLAMVEPIYCKRPTCEKILEQMLKWELNKDALVQREDLSIILEKLKLSSCNFFNDFLCSKLNLNTDPC